MVNLVKHDLEFILKQIEIAEAHAAGGDLANLVAGYNGNDGLTQAHLLPYGLRTVDGSYNNLIPGRENWGASDQSFPGIFTPTYLNDADGDQHNFGSHDLNGDGLPDTPPVWYTNNDYGNAGPGSGSNPGPGSGTVIDADPRLISNLVVDQTLNNPAAITAALMHAGLSGIPLTAALTSIVNAHTVLKAIAAPVGNEVPSAAYVLAKAALDGLLQQHGVEMDGNSVLIPNVSPDDGLSAPFNGWMTIFGQFFDHGLDLVAKGGNGTIYVPLQPDDPLYVEGSPTNYMVLTRVTVDAGPDGRLGTADDGATPKNLTTPWVDQNQTYGSTASKQVFMREYVAGPDGKPIATGHLLEGSKGGLATWADIKKQAADVLGIRLTDANVGNIPLLAADEYGNFIRGPNGYPQLVVGLGPDGQLGTADDVLREGNPASPVSAQGVVLTGHAFLDDIAHAAVPVMNSAGVLLADGDTGLGYFNADGTPGAFNSRGTQTSYDNEMLDAHYIAGDGRANENIALTAVHHVFHSEHNRVVEMTKQIALDSGDLAFLNEWLLVPVTALPTTEAAKEALIWNGERLFQAGRFTNEMEYQHLVFEEFGRMMQPDIDAFLFEPSADINPSIAAEFAHVVYRFGHSMLREDIARISLDENGNPVQNDLTLFEGFLNPVEFANSGLDADEAAGAIIRGMTRQTGSEIDEFVTDVLRNQLLGIPLDLATINLARGRDVGTPPLNEARQRFFDETGDTLLKPYESWADYALNLKNPASIINFIAAYGSHDSVADAQTVEDKRAAATLLVLGGAGAPADRLDFLNATGAYAGGTLGGLGTVDFWIGGLAEKKMSFGGMLGSTFSFVFQMTMENLQDADRFYYLSRTQGLNLLNELENNSFAELVMRNTDLGDPGSTALPGNVFSAFQMPILEMDLSKQLGADPVQDDPTLQAFSNLVERRDANADGVAEYIRVNSNEHFVIGGTENNDKIISGGGDDAIWGRGGNDTIEAGYGVDKVFGGEGDDIITNAGTDIGEADFLHGNEGNDVIHGGSGLSLIFGNEGNDFLIAGPDGKQVIGGTGNDFILGGTGMDFLLGNEGDDWIEGGQRFDTLAGDNSELFFNSTIVGHDVLNGGSGDTDFDGESGDDIMFQNEGIQRSNGMAGFDWGIHKGSTVAANSDLGIPIFETQEAFILRDRFDLVEGLSGWRLDDVLTGRSVAVNTRAELEGTAAIPGPDSPLDSYSNALLQKNVALINGLDQLVAHLDRTTVTVAGKTEQIVMDTADASDILLGGGGSDTIKGLAGNDIIDGDKWLNVRILVTPVAGQTWTPFSVDSMEALVPRMISGEINPGQLTVVREILDGHVAGDIDTAVYTDIRANYTFGVNADGSLFVDHTGFVRPQQDDDLPEGEGLPNPRSDGRDTLRGIEKLDFTDFDLNVIEGTNSGEALNGTAQDDLIVGKGGNDTLNGLAGNDILIGGSGNDQLNGGLGNDTYIFNLTDGADTINELANATSGGSADRIVIQAAGAELTNLNAVDNNTGTNNGSLVIRVNDQQITVASHFTGTNSQTGVEFINFDNATFNGFELGDGDYAVSRADPAGPLFGLLPRTVDLSSSDVDNLVAGEEAGENIIGGSGNDLIFGNIGNDNLVGGAGDDLLVGGDGTDELDGGAGADVMVGGSGNDTYIVDDEDDGVVEAANGGTDEVRTTLATYSLAANVENLTFTGAGAFVGTGNDLNNVIVGGAGVDTLSGLGGSDTYIVTAGDVIVEGAGGGTDTVQSSESYTLGTNLENLTLTGNANVIGRGNGDDNIINGNSGDNQLFGGGGNDSINGNGGNDFIDGGTGNDTINGGSGDNTLIGGSGDDTINLTSGNGTDDVIRYTATGFGSDIINGFDANANGGQDRIDLSALGVTSANFSDRVSLANGTGSAQGDTIVTVRNADSSIAGTIRIDNVTVGTGTSQISIGDFIVAATPSNPIGNPNNNNNAITGGNNSEVINGLGGNDTLNGGGGNDTITGGTGNDVIDGGAGDDTIIWNANASGPTDGRDIVVGGAEGTAGDTFVVNGNTSGESYQIFTLAAWDAVAGNSLNSFGGRTPEIVITRNGAGFANVIAELTGIEEIRINSVDPAGASGAAGAGDTFQIFGDFSGTSLRLNTITIVGDAGDDTIDISSLSSAHRIVFRSNGGKDTILGTLRSHDVIELAPGLTVADYTQETDANGMTTLTSGDHTITYTCSEPPALREHAIDEGPVEVLVDTPVDPSVDGPVDTPVDAPIDEPIANPPSPSDATPVEIQPPVRITLPPVDQHLQGGRRHDRLSGEDGNDRLYGEGGNDDLKGGAGNDKLYGGAGHDRLDGGTGADQMWGGTGNDVYVVDSAKDRVIEKAGQGIDTVKSSVSYSLAANVEKLTLTGTGDLKATGNRLDNVLSGNSGDNVLNGGAGHDILRGGAGDDRLIGGSGNDRLTGGSGEDFFVFQKFGGRDTVLDFRNGQDRVDVRSLSGVNEMSDLTIVQGFGHVEIRHGNDVLVLEGVSAADLDKSDFVF